MPISVSTIPSQVTQFTAADAITAVEGEATLVLQADPTVGGATLSAIAIAAVTLPVEATLANMEGEAAGYLLVPPDLVMNSPGVAKAWCQVTTGGGLGSGDYGVASVAKGATGKYVITFDTAFASAVYAVSVTVESGAAIFGSKSTAASDTSAVDIWTHAGAAVDAAFYFTAFGTLA